MNEVLNPWRSPAGLVAVRFLAMVPPYNAGEVAGFADDVAVDYVKRGLAEYYQPADAAAPPPPPPPVAETRTHELTIDGVGELAESITDPAEITRLIDGEKAHPKHPGGRKGAMEFLELRAAELAPPPPPPPVA